MTTVDKAREALLAAIYTSGSYECDAMVDALIAAVRAEYEPDADGLQEREDFHRAESAETLRLARGAALDEALHAIDALPSVYTYGQALRFRDAAIAAVAGLAATPAGEEAAE